MEKNSPNQPTLAQTRGFTLLETLLVVAMTVVIATFSLPVYQNLQIANDLDAARRAAVTSLRRAEALAQAVDGDSRWGVRINAGTITLFQGASFTSRNPAFDEVTTYPATITPSGLMEVVFAKLTGLPQTTGTLTLASAAGTQTVSLNAQGMVDF